MAIEVDDVSQEPELASMEEHEGTHMPLERKWDYAIETCEAHERTSTRSEGGGL